MASRKSKNKSGHLTIPHFETNLVIKNCKTCANCTYRVFAEPDEKVILGVGTIFASVVFVLPSYDVKAKIGYETILTILVDKCKELTGINILESLYITRIVKCHKKTSYSLYHDSIKPCNNFINYEFSRLTPKVVVFFGDAYSDYSSNNSAINFKSGYNANVIILKAYSPGVLFHNNTKVVEAFESQLRNVLSHNIIGSYDTF